MSLKVGELIAELIRESVCILRVKVMWLLDVPSIDENFTIDGLELVGAWLEHPRDDVWSPYGRENLWRFLLLWMKRSSRSPTLKA